MIQLFWLGAAVMLAIGLALILPTLFGRHRIAQSGEDSPNVRVARERLEELDADLRSGKLDQVEFEQAKRELEAGLIDDLTAEEAASAIAQHGGGRWMGSVLLLLVPVLSIGLYTYLGDYPALTNATNVPQAAAVPHAVEGETGPQMSVEQMVKGLATRLQTNPDDANGWFMLGRSYMVLERYAEAADALQHVHALVGDQPDVLVAYADALAMASGGRMTGEPKAMIDRALTLDPQHGTALWLAGMASNEQGDFTAAIAYWQRLLPIIQDSPESTAEVKTLIARAESQGGTSVAQTDAEPVSPVTASDPAPAVSASLQVEVTLDAALKDKVDPNDTLFVFARALQGPPMPLAVARKRVADLPLTVTLDDTMAMMPAMKLSNFPDVLVGARISKSGNAIPQSGDYSGQVAPVTVKTTTAPLKINIDSLVP